MLTLDNLKHHCRTCLIKIELSSETNESKKSIAIAKVPDVEQLMHICLENGSWGARDYLAELDTHMPYLCSLCFTKWADFAQHFQLAVKSDEKLKAVLNKDITLSDVLQESCIETNQLFLDANPKVDDFLEIEKFETVSPFYPASRSSSPPTDFNNADEFSMCPSLPPASPEFHFSEGDRPLDSIEPDTAEFSRAELKKLKQPVERRKHSKRKSKTLSQIGGTTKSLAASSAKRTKRQIYRCEPCNKYFYEVPTYEGHVRRVHEGIKKAYQCKECDKAYSLYKNLVEHTAEKHASEPQVNQCEQCQKTYKTKKSLSKHVRLQHSDLPDKPSYRRPVICEQCGFLAAHQDSLIQHIRNRHTETEDIQCEHCPRVFKSHYNLKYHVESSHSKVVIKPHVCSECPMAFARISLLNIHKRSHITYAERIKCDFEGCDVRFIKLSSKRRHMRLVHLKVKQHVCDICGEAFGIKATLRHHRYIHTGEKPYKCPTCGQAFRQQTAMKTHRKTHYGKETTTRVPAEAMKDAVSEKTYFVSNLVR